VSIPAGSKQPVVTQGNNCKLVQQERNQSHYDSDTEVDTTDDERKVDSSFLGDTDDLLNDDKKTFSNIPKRINHRKKYIFEAVAGPSSRNVSGGTVDSGHDEECSPQDLLDNFFKV
jgi:hypothetical protein